MTIGQDRDGRPIVVGATVEWLYDPQRPRLRRKVLHPAADNRSHSLEGGYMAVTTDQPGRIHMRYGMNLRVVVDDEDLVVDEGL